VPALEGLGGEPANQETTSDSEGSYNENADFMRLCELPTTPHFATSTHNLLEHFYLPALSSSIKYDRGVGYFTSNWLRLAASGLSIFAGNGGKARIIASPKLDRDDCAALNQGTDARNDPALRGALERTLTDLEHDLTHDTLAAIAWMVADGLLEFRIAIPTGELDGDFHDKFGIFRDKESNSVAFHGSPNDSEKAFHNYESISVYYSWIDGREALRVQNEQGRFNLIWDNGDINLRVYELPDAIRRNLIEFTTRTPRPYASPNFAPSGNETRWQHQRDAVSEFLRKKHGILEMATGTGKTRTALRIIEELTERGLIDTTVIAAYGTDLLDQWHKEILRRQTIPVFRAYERHREAQQFLNDPAGTILLTSRQSLVEILPRLRNSVYPDDFKRQSDIIAGLLVDAELDRKGIQPEDRASIEREMVKIVDPTSPTRLNGEGNKLLNLYAAAGFTLIQDKMMPPTTIEDFLIAYHGYWHDQTNSSGA
jgi:hypothetical protein